MTDAFRFQHVPAAPGERRRAPALLAGCALAAIAGSLAPDAAHAQAFAADPVYSTPGVTITRGSGTDDIQIDTPTAIIDWFAGGTDGSPYDLLPAGNTVTYTNDPVSGNDFIVLNRLSGEIPSPMVFNGTVNSQLTPSGGGPAVQGGSVWFYSPSGIVVGATGAFNVGSLLLTANEVLTDDFDQNGDPDDIAFAPDGSVQLRPASVDSRAAVIVEAGAQINARSPSSYSAVALIAPRVDMGGSVDVEGTAAYVAAESVNINLDAGLFDILILSGSYVDTNIAGDDTTLVHSGTTTGPAETVPGQQIILLASVPKNDAVTMLVSGDIGYQPAASATVDNGTIYLSSGGFDAVAEDFVRAPGGAVAGASEPQGSIVIEDATFSSRTQGYATDTLTVTADGADVSFSADATLLAGNGVALGASNGSTISVGGDALLASNNGQGGTVSVAADSGGQMDFGGDLDVDVADTAMFGDSEEQGGTASLVVNGATIAVAGDLDIDASGVGDEIDMIVTSGRGGSVDITGFAGGAIGVGGSLSATADGSGGTFATQSGDGSGGTVSLYAEGSTIAADGDIALSARGEGGSSEIAGGGGFGGFIDISLTSDAALDAGGQLFADVTSLGGAVLSSGTAETGGDGDGRDARISILASDSVLSAATVDLAADGEGGDSASGFAGGAGFGGTVSLSAVTSDAIGLPPGEIAADVVAITASAAGGGHVDSGFGGAGGAATGGAVDITVSGRIGENGAVAIGSESLLIDASAEGGSGGDSFDALSPPGAGGAGSGGAVILDIQGGTIDFATIVAAANGVGGSGGAFIGSGGATAGGAGGDGSGGSVHLGMAGGGLVADSLQLVTTSAGGDGGASDEGDGGDGGTGSGGEVLVDLASGASMTTQSLQLVAFNAGGAGGTGTAAGGAGGAATGGSAALAIGNGTSLDTGTAGFEVSATGGTGGEGASAGAGGDATGGTATLTGGIGSGTMSAGATTLHARAAGGAAGGTGVSGEALGGTAEIALAGGTLSLGNVDIAADGASGTGTAIGGTARIAVEGGSVAASFAAIDASGRSDDATGAGGSATVAVADNMSTAAPGSASLGSVAIEASGVSASGATVAGSVAIENGAAAAGSLSFTSLAVEVFGASPSSSDAFSLLADTGTIAVSGTTDIEVDGDAIFSFAGTGALASDVLTVDASGSIAVAHGGIGPNAVSIDTSLARFAAAAFHAAPGGPGGASHIRASSLLEIDAAGVVEADRLSGGDLSITAGSGATMFKLDATGSILVSAADANFTGSADAAGAIDVDATGAIGILGPMTATDVILSSADVEIASSGSLRGEFVTFENLTGETAFVGGSDADHAGSYSLDAAELARVAGSFVQLLSLDVAGGPGLIVEDADLTGSGAGSTSANLLGTDGGIFLYADDGILVRGLLTVGEAAAGNFVSLHGGAYVRVVTPTGAIVLRGAGGLPGGELRIRGDEVIAASQATIAALAGTASIAERDAILGGNPGPVNNEGYLVAGAIELAGRDAIYVQNSGVHAGSPDQRAGFTAGTGGLTLVTTSFAEPTEIIVNGRILGTGGTATTGAGVIPAAEITGDDGTPPNFDQGSTINSCLIVGGNCQTPPPPPPGPTPPPPPPPGPTPPPPPPPPPGPTPPPPPPPGPTPPPPPPTQVQERVPTQDVVDELTETDEEEEPVTQPKRDLSAPLVEMGEFGGNRPGPMIDDPVTGAGNDDLWVGGSDGGEE